MSENKNIIDWVAAFYQPCGFLRFSAIIPLLIIYCRLIGSQVLIQLLLVVLLFAIVMQLHPGTMKFVYYKDLRLAWPEFPDVM